MNLVSAYFDESENVGDVDTPPMISVGGYFFNKENALLFDAEWRSLLNRYELTHFSMADCNSQWGEFKKYSNTECIGIQTEFIEVLKRRALRGFAACMETSLGRLLPSAKSHGINLISPYSFCSYWCLFYGRTWGQQNKFSGRIAYFYEQGYLRQPEFDRIIGDMFANDSLKDQFFYASHTFADKRDVPQLQAADILAWQWRMHSVRRSQGKPMRRDLASILEIPSDKMDFDEPTILDFLGVVRGNRLEKERRLRSLRDAIKKVIWGPE
jgi:hypothetical protein